MARTTHRSTGGKKLYAVRDKEGQFLHFAAFGAKVFADQIGPGDAKVNATRRQFAGNFARRQQHRHRALDAFDDAGIFAVRPRPPHRHAPRAEPVERVLHQAAF